MVAETLITPRLILRQPKATDLPVYTAYCASERTRFVGGPYDAVKAFEKFCAMIGHWTVRGFGRYVIERGGVPIGHVGPLALSDETPELTWTLWEGSAEGQGYASEAAHGAARHLLVDCGWQKLQISILDDNAASKAVASRIGALRTDKPSPPWFPGAVIFELEAEMLA